MTDEQKTAIYDILVEEAGASESFREMFMQQFPECKEFRFSGALGFGGKVWHRPSYSVAEERVYVSCYQEDETPLRTVIISRTNEKLQKVLEG